MKKQNEQLSDFVENELSSEWFHDGGEVFIKWGKILLGKGFSIEEIKTMFSDLYNAVSAEYGD